jgi:hypothetical protein
MSAMKIKSGTEAAWDARERSPSHLRSDKRTQSLAFEVAQRNALLLFELVLKLGAVLGVRIAELCLPALPYPVSSNSCAAGT